jgi:Ca-activated chloride channel family protein
MLVRLLGLLSLCSAAWAYQGDTSDTPATIVPRLRSAIVVPEPGDLGRAQLRVDASLVLIPAQVTTPGGGPVADLRQKDFRLFEDNVEQAITHFSRDDSPVSIGVLLDSSGSMTTKMRKTLEAATAFFKTANPQDEFFLVDFNERARLAVSLTNDARAVFQRIRQTRPFGRTSLFDAIDLGLREIKHARNERRALVILSDGGDNRSRRSLREVRGLLQESDVQVYALGIFDDADLQKRPKEEQEGPRVLDELAEMSGGRHYRIGDIDDLPEMAARLGEELRTRYVLAYSPANGVRDGKYRKVKVDVLRPGPLNVQYRRGYYAPQ